jgi:hypothetical protein
LVIAVLVIGQNRTNFETSLAEDAPELSVYIPIKSTAKIFVTRAMPKMNAVKLVAAIKNVAGQIPFLCTPQQIQLNEKIDTLYARAYMARFITGEKLKNRLGAAAKIVPTIQMPTLIFDIVEGADFFELIDSFPACKTIAAAGARLNVVALFSSQNDEVREYINAFLNQKTARELVGLGIFIFFIDRIKTDNDAMYYFFAMLDAQTRAAGVTPPDRDIVIVSRKSVSYSVTDIRSQTTKYHRLARGQEVLDQFGEPIKIGFDAILNRGSIKITETKSRATNALSKSLYQTKKQINKIAGYIIPLIGVSR